MGKATRHQRRGRGSPVYRSPSHRHHGAIEYPEPRVSVSGKVLDLEHDPARTAPVAIVDIGGGKTTRFIATAGLAVADSVNVNNGGAGNQALIALKDIPEGTRICNIETMPGDGGKLVRAAGGSALIVTQGERVMIELPSGSYKYLNPLCRATIGIVGGAGRGDKPFAKAGNAFYAWRSRAREYITVRGVAMNPVNHPHGGGSHQHIGRPNTVGRGTWPGRKVGRLSPKKGRAARRKGAED